MYLLLENRYEKNGRKNVFVVRRPTYVADVWNLCDSEECATCSKLIRCVYLCLYTPMFSRRGLTVHMIWASALLSVFNLTTMTVRDNSRDATRQLMTIVRHITSSAHGQGETERINLRLWPSTEFADNQSVGFSAAPSHLFVFNRFAENSLVLRCRHRIIPHVPNNKGVLRRYEKLTRCRVQQKHPPFFLEWSDQWLWKYWRKDQRENTPIKRFPGWLYSIWTLKRQGFFKVLNVCMCINQ